MHTLEQLRRGDLAGATRLDLSADLDSFPEEIFGLADSLEILNLSDNRLTSLPSELARLHKLRVVFFSGNPFTHLPEVLGDCPTLEMVGFKGCQIRHVPAEALPPALRWLILTGNAVDTLPDELGARPRLQKLMLAGNRLSSLPPAIEDARHLELIRIAANRFDTLPEALLALPKLAWLAFAGNPISDAQERRALASHPIPAISRTQVVKQSILGQGASGVIHRASWKTSETAPEQAMALKVFKGQVTSDGLPHSEMAACLAAGRHPNLVGVAGPLEYSEHEPDALLLDLMDTRYRILADPPSLASCTRDVYPEDRTLDTRQVLRILEGVASVGDHLHREGILHGDLYAHNLAVDSGGNALLGDFGAASFFDPDSQVGQRLKRLDVLAFGHLLDELLAMPGQAQDRSVLQLHDLAVACRQPDVTGRPDFAEIKALLSTELA